MSSDRTGNSHDRLVHMANQIARNFAVMGEAEAAKATADHIDKFWDPRMKAAVFADAAGLAPTAAAAIAILRSDGPPEPQTRATRFNAVNETIRSDGA